METKESIAISVKRLLIGMELETEVQGMIAANKESEFNNQSPFYTEIQFVMLSNLIKDVALMSDEEIKEVNHKNIPKFLS